MTDIIVQEDSGVLVASEHSSTILIVTPVTDTLSRIEVIDPPPEEVFNNIDVSSYDDVVVISGGERGPRGPEGPPGSGAEPYTQFFTSPLSTWTINHNLDRVVSVEVTDLSGNEILCNPQRVSSNQVKVVHKAPRTGIVIVT